MTLVDLIKNASGVLIVCHTLPDGDALGAGFALFRVCELLEIPADFLCDSPLPKQYEFIDNSDKFRKKKACTYDLSIAVDCADEFRMGEQNDLFFSTDNTINIDHHISNTNFAKYNFTKPDASSTCEIIFGLLKNNPELIDDYVAEYLYMGISSDTGHFRHSNTGSGAYYAAAELLKHNFNTASIVDELYRSNSAEKLQLLGIALNKMRFYCDEKFAIIVLSHKDLVECCCRMSDTEGIIDYPMTIKQLEVAVCMSQQSQSSFKVSFRSKNIDVSVVAAKFGGGGHKLAAGCVVNGDYNTCVKKVIDAVTEQINEWNYKCQ